MVASAITGAVMTGLGSGGGGMASLAAGMFQFQTVVEGLKGALSALTGAVQNTVDSVRPFVEAFNPSGLRAWDRAMRDVTAVIGTALVPIVRGATTIVRGFGEAILPTASALSSRNNSTCRAIDSSNRAPRL